jgi:hypothetical protein
MLGFGNQHRPNPPFQRLAIEYGNVLQTFQKTHKGNQLRLTLNEERKTNLERLGINLIEALRRYNTNKTGNRYNPTFVKQLKNASRLIKKIMEQDRKEKKN